MRKSFWKLLVALLTVVLAVALWLNWKYEVVAFGGVWNGSGNSDVKMLTWNVCSLGDGFDGRKAAELILQEDADVVVVNEYCDSTAHEMDSLLLTRYKYVEGSKDGQCDDILYSKFPISGYESLSDDSLVSLTYRCQLNVKEKRVALFFCHLASNNKQGDGIEDVTKDNTEDGWENYKANYRSAQEHRIQEMERIGTYVDSVRMLPTIVIGDMNDFSCSQTLKPLIARSFEDAWWKCGLGYGATYKYKYVRLRIDHFMYNFLLKPRRVKVVNSGTLSDHNALLGEFMFR